MSVDSAAPASVAFRTWVLRGLLLAGAALTLLWLWSCWCSFPSNPWNDIRSAPAIALLRGFSIYQPAGGGPASTWAYGPLPVLLLAPAGLAPDAAGAIETAGAIHIAVRAGILLFVCLTWPVPSGDGPTTRLVRGASALICILWVRNGTSGYTIINSDAYGVSVGLLSLLALTRGHRWLAAFGAAAAVACKQTMIGVGAAQVIWLFLSDSPRAALGQIGRGALAGLVVAAGAIALFGAPGLWHILFEMPRRYAYAPSALQRLLTHPGYLAIHVILPLALMAAARRAFFARTSPLLLPAIAFLCALPMSLAGLLSIGGNVNSLHSFWLWLPPVLLIGSATLLPRLGWSGQFAYAAIPALVACVWLQLSPVRLRPNIAHYAQAEELARRMPEQVWFPMNPVITLYSDGRLYHDFDGLRAWDTTGFRPDDRLYFAHLPARFRGMATLLPIAWGPSDDARLPPNCRVVAFGTWQVDLLPE